MKKTKLGQELIQGLQEVIAHKRGEISLRTHAVELPNEPPEFSKTEIVNIRVEQLKVSQPIFAAYLGVKISVLRSWEQGKKNPSGAARRLLQIVANDPSFVEKVVSIGSKRKSHTKVRRSHSVKKAALG